MKLPRFRRAPAPPPPADDGNELRMSLLDHLNELRQRLTKAVLALVVGTIIGAVVAGEVFEYLLSPYCVLQAVTDCRLQVLGPTEGIVAYFRVALMLGAIIAIPVLTYQILMFVVPGLTRKERRFVLMALPAITLLFLTGVAFAWFVLMPPALGFLQGFMPTLFKPEWTADLYLSFITALIFWMGVAFEMPLVLFVLALLGFVRAGTLARNWRIAVVLASIAAAFITPTVDPVNMMLVMLPLMGLYLISIGLVWIGTRQAGLQDAPPRSRTAAR
ncbi:twin-arginine translocase subunit TatC (plasmid) [Aggregatilineales bacterium SYSU G02658]